MRFRQWIFLLSGLWLVVSPWVLGFSQFNLPRWNSIFLGLFIIFVTFTDSLPPESKC